MAGQLTIDTLRASSGVLATQNGMTGIAKAWVNYNANTQTITGSYNVSSVTYNSSGYFTINFTTAMPNATYSAVATCSPDSGNLGNIATVFSNASTVYVAPSTSSFTVVTLARVSGTTVNPYAVTATVLSS